ncbi:MAG: Ku protein [Actinomycetota bacterium]|nr:Ku protein [Actinomycetota bacterium]
MRSIWNGAVSFGLVSVPVRVYAATANHDIQFHQVHEPDGGRIRYKRFCELCGAEVTHVDIVKGYETEDGELVTLNDDDMASLPTPTGREIEVVEFVPAEQVDPLLLDRSYYLEPEPRAIKPYALLREALRQADRMAVARVALRQRETLALLRVRGKVIVMQTMLWPDEVREPDFETLRDDVELRPQELQMAASLVSTMGADFDPTQFDDGYKKAVEELIDYKRQHGGARPAPAAAETGGAKISDLLTALQRSVEEARTGRKPPNPSGPGQRKAAAKPGTRKPSTRKPAAKKTPGESEAPTKKTGGRSQQGT